MLDRFAEAECRVPKEWFDYGRDREWSAQWRLGTRGEDARAPASLRDWVERARSLSAIPGGLAAPVACAPASRHLTPKKTHEIARVSAFLRQAELRPERILDVGGGAGHLARVLARDLGCEVISIDRDARLQAKGLRLLERDGARRSVRFVSGDFVERGAELAQVPGTLVVGLHTCGGLAWEQLELVRGGNSLLNIGCCYDRLDPHREVDRSAEARARPLAWTVEGLFLANRGGVERGEAEFLRQQRVQRHRFALHALLRERGFDSSEIAAMGTAPLVDYEGSFEVYARGRIRARGWEDGRAGELSDRALREAEVRSAPFVERQRFVAWLRNVLARPLEIALLRDRARWLEETAPGMEVRLVELFEPAISPRNVALLAVPRAGLGLRFLRS